MRSVPVVTALLLVSLLAQPVQAGQLKEEFRPPDGLTEGWYARIETSLGRIIVRLLPEQAPESVAHFAALAEGRLEWNDPVTGQLRKGRYYDGAEVYRATAAQLFQVGQRSGAGDPTPFLYVPRKEGQPVNFGLAGRMGNVRVGPKLSAARFQITATSMPGFSNTVPCFGVVAEGLDTVHLISTVKTHPNGQPLEPVIIERIRLFEIGEPEPLPEPVPYYPEQHPLIKLDLRDDPPERKD